MMGRFLFSCEQPLLIIAHELILKIYCKSIELKSSLSRIQGHRSTGAKGGSAPPFLGERGKEGKNALLLQSTDLIFSHFLLTFVLF